MKYTIEALVEVPGPLRDEYAKGEDGKFHLKVEGHPDTARVAEFRDRNIALAKERDELKTKLAGFDGIDAAAAKAALARSGDDGEVAKLRQRVTDAESTAAAATQKHDQLVFRSRVSAAFLAAGGRPEAVDYMVGKAPFTLADDELKPKDATTPTVEEWLKDAAIGPTAFAFLPNAGGGAIGQKPPMLTLGQRSGVKQLVDPTPQQLGEHAQDIAAGRVKVAYTNG